MGARTTFRTLVGLVLGVVTLPIPALAQISTEPPSLIPVDNPLALLVLSAAFVATAYLILRRRQHRAALMSGWCIVLMAGVLWQSPSLRAQLLFSFTNPAGETLPIPATQIPDNGDIAGFEMADYTNDSGVRLRVAGLVPPGFNECFPSGSALGLLPAGPPDPAPPPACTLGQTLLNGDTCRVDVDAACRAEVTGEVTISAAPDTLHFAGTGIVTLTNDLGRPGLSADNLVATIPGGSNILVLANDCPAALVPGASCDITLFSGTEESETVVIFSGDNTFSVAVLVTVDVEPLACDGTVFGNFFDFCWYLGASGQSCTEVCDGRGGNDPAGTTSFAGSGGTDADCGDVMTALENDTGLPFNPTPVVAQAGVLGCASDITDIAFTIRHTGLTDAGATGANIRRACACNE